MKQVFEAIREELLAMTSEFADGIVASLQSSFMVMPKTDGFVEYSTFESGYRVLRKTTRKFTELTPETLRKAIEIKSISLIVVRTILGFTPPEWAYLASERTRVEVNGNYARALDQRIRKKPDVPLTVRGIAVERIEALLRTACDLIQDGAPPIGEATLHRLDKCDTRSGQDSLRQVASINVPYPMLLYERLLGRPFATHRDAMSERVADIMEVPVEEALTRAGVPFRKTKRAEKLSGFDQAPDFCVPDEFNPLVIIEAKITEDEGTARDKITRVQRLALMNQERVTKSKLPFEVIACIDGRGFTRRSDLEKLILATNGKIFTLKTIGQMVSFSRLQEFAAD